MPKHFGSCLCGHVAFEVEGEPVRVTNCHCSMCQKAAGAAYVTWAEFPTANIIWTGAEPTCTASSDQGERGFCPKCGSAITFHYLDGGTTDLACVLFDDPSAFPPTDEIFTATKQDWAVLNPDIPHYKGARKDG